MSKNTPLVVTPISILGLPSHGKVDPKVLGQLVRPNEVYLTLESGGLVLVRGQLIAGGLLELAGQLAGASDKEIHQILPVNGLEVPAICKASKEKLNLQQKLKLEPLKPCPPSARLEKKKSPTETETKL